MKIDLDLTPEQAALLVKMYEDGVLSAYGVTNVSLSVGGPSPHPPHQRLPRRVFARVAASFLSSAASVLCSLSGCLLASRVPYLVAGAILGLLGGVFGFKRSNLMIFGALALAINAAAWGLYAVHVDQDSGQADDDASRVIEADESSTMIVVVPLYRGDRSEVLEGPDGTRIRYFADNKTKRIDPSGLTARVATEGTKELLGLFGGPKFKELVPGSDEAKRFSEYERMVLAMHKSGKLSVAGVSQEGLRPGRRPLGMKAKGKPVYEKDVYIPKSSNVYVILDKNQDDSLHVVAFLPDITKPTP